MDQNAKIDPAIKALYEKLTSRDTHLMEVNSARCGRTGIIKGTYTCCSACFSVIERPWDHAEWCELYKEEELSAWIKKGKNEK